MVPCDALLVHHCLWCEFILGWRFPAEKEHWYGRAFEASISEAWSRHAPRNGKPLFSMILALPEIGYREAHHGS